MRSSSSLFPVSLIAAEVIGDLHDDAYLLNPGISPDPTVRLAVSRITDPGFTGRRQPVVLLHSEFQNRQQWLTRAGDGLAQRLARAGCDVWLPEMRGHGRSPRNRTWANGSLIEFAGQDWPAVHRFVTEQADEPPIWVAQGIGAVSLAHMLINFHRTASRVPGVVFIEPGKPGSHWLQKKLSRRERWGLARRTSLFGDWGPEEEPVNLFQTLFGWQRAYRKGKGHPVYDQLRSIRNRAMVISNGNDEQARVFAGLLGGQSRATAFTDPEARSGGVSACAVMAPSVQAELITWVREAASETSGAGAPARSEVL